MDKGEGSWIRFLYWYTHGHSDTVYSLQTTVQPEAAEQNTKFLTGEKFIYQ